MTIHINRSVFDSAKAYNSLQLEALEAADKISALVEQLIEAANNTYSSPEQHNTFQTMPLHFGASNSASLSDFAILYQDIDKDGTISDMSLVDLSFDVTNNAQGHMLSGAMVRYNSSLQPPAKEGEPPRFRRQPGIDDFVEAKYIDALGDKLFTWVFKHIPESQQNDFLNNCEKAGLVESKKADFGFGFIDHKSRSETSPSLH